MSMYPSLEDMKATELIKAQVNAMKPVQYEMPQPNQYGGSLYGSGGPSAPIQTMERSVGGYSLAAAYPSLTDFMGMELSEEMIRLNMPEYGKHGGSPYPALANNGNVVANMPNSSIVQQNNSGVSVIAPISGSNAAVVKSMITHGVRRLNVVKDSGKVGLRVRAMNTGVFVCLVMDGTPAARTGLRFGDQILQIDGQDMAGMSVDKVHTIFRKKSAGEAIDIVVRDRPFERTVTLVRDSHGCIGFQFRGGKIINIVKESSAARNGVLTDHNLLEINGKNVIGLKDKEIAKVIDGVQGNALNITIMPAFLYDHMVKEMAGSLFGKMDHSTPEF